MPAPANVSDTGLLAPASPAVDRWLDVVAAMRIDDWVLAGRACRDDAGRAARAAAQEHIHGLVLSERLELVAWSIVDDLEALLYAAPACPAPLSRSTRRTIDAAHKAAGWVALAILLGSRVTPEYRRVIEAPFSACMTSRLYLA